MSVKKLRMEYSLGIYKTLFRSRGVSHPIAILGYLVVTTDIILNIQDIFLLIVDLWLTRRLDLLPL